MQWDILAQAIVNGILIGGVYSLASVGLNLIFGVVKIVNFAHGEFIMLGMYSTYWSWALFGIDPLLSLVITMPLMFLFGVIVQRFLFQPILKAPELAQIFMTIGLQILLQNLALAIFSANYRSIPTAYGAIAYHLGPIVISAPRLFAFIISVVLSAALGFLLLGTDLGKAMRAAAQDREVAELMGINQNYIFLIAVGLAAALAGAAGTVVMPFFYAYPTAGIAFGLKSFVVAIAGGLGSVRGAFIMGLILGAAESLGVQYVGADAGMLVAFIILLVVLVLRPQGIFAGGRL